MQVSDSHPVSVVFPSVFIYFRIAIYPGSCPGSAYLGLAEKIQQRIDFSVVPVVYVPIRDWKRLAAMPRGGDSRRWRQR